MADLPAQIRAIQPDLDEFIKRQLVSGVFIGGDPVAEFENSFAEFTHSPFCVAVGNGTDAIEIALLSLDLRDRRKVLVPSNSFVATAEAVRNVGLDLVLVDAADDFGFDREDLLSKLDSEVGAVIAVHLFGYPQDLSWLQREINGRGIFLIEDCSQAHGAIREGKHVGTLGDIGTFSFYPGKNLGALGDAGAIITANSKFAKTAKRISNHGRLSKFDHEILGRNSRMDTIQAGVLSLKLGKLNYWNLIRFQNAKRYLENLSPVVHDLLFPPLYKGAVFHHFVLRTKDRDHLRSFLYDNGIETGIHYPNSIDELPAFSPYATSPCLKSQQNSKTMLSLPVGEHLTFAEIDYVSQRIIQFFQK